jgi:hypothetical protein
MLQAMLQRIRSSQTNENPPANGSTGGLVLNRVQNFGENVVHLPHRIVRMNPIKRLLVAVEALHSLIIGASTDSPKALARRFIYAFVVYIASVSHASSLWFVAKERLSLTTSLSYLQDHLSKLALVNFCQKIAKSNVCVKRKKMFRSKIKYFLEGQFLWSFSRRIEESSNIVDEKNCDLPLFLSSAIRYRLTEMWVRE